MQTLQTLAPRQLARDTQQQRRADAAVGVLRATHTAAATKHERDPHDRETHVLATPPYSHPDTRHDNGCSLRSVGRPPPPPVARSGRPQWTWCGAPMGCTAQTDVAARGSHHPALHATHQPDRASLGMRPSGPCLYCQTARAEVLLSSTDALHNGGDHDCCSNQGRLLKGLLQSGPVFKLPLSVGRGHLSLREQLSVLDPRSALSKSAPAALQTAAHHPKP